MFGKFLLLNLLSLIIGSDTPGEMPQAELLFVGDAMQHEGQLTTARQIGNGKYDYKECFELITPEIMESDFAVCNLEVPLGGGPSYTGYPCFSAPDSYAEALRDAGFNMMLTANNHCLDKRDKAARRTLDVLDSLQVIHTGTFKNKEEREKLIPLVQDINGFKVGFLNYTYGTNGISPQDGMEVALIDKEKIKKEIQKTKDAGAEIIVVCMHWGIEYVLTENQVQRDLADFLVKEGVDLIIGGHPHVIQPMKVVRNEKDNKDVLVVYSLGNFISNMKTADTRGGALVRTTLKRDENGKAYFSNADYDIFFAAKPVGKSNFKVIPSWMESKVPTGQQAHWKLFERGAKKIFDQYNVKVPQKH